ncbi:MAG: leucyl aminopeptidase [Verrucomicrobiota bacterium]
MKISLKNTTQALSKTDLLVIFARQGSKAKLPQGVQVPPLALKSFEGKEREMRLTDATDGPAARVLLIGLGDSKTIDCETLRRCGALATKKAEKTHSASVAIYFDLPVGKQSETLGQALAEGAVMGAYRLTDFQSTAKPAALKRLLIYGNKEFKLGAIHGQIIAQANCLARRLKDTPGNLMRPRDLVSEAKKIAKNSSSLSVKIIDEKAMARLKMDALLSVSKGSCEPAYLIHLIYKPKKKSSRKICLVGKGLTFDAGGISLKPSGKMDEMKYDMSGGAAVLGVFKALAEMDIDAEVHGLVPTSENLPDGKAVKPGDLVTAMNGLSIEVLNTDAEGRLILADALCYAKEKIKPDAMIDLATLTGAVVVALGHEMSGVMGNDQNVIDDLIAAGKRSGELVWPLPLHDVHQEEMKGKVGDLRNISSPGAGAGSSTGGAFLSNFVDDIPWAHLDIAGSAWGAADRDYQGGAKGTGVGVRLLIDYLQQS